ncbi:hypothetical protein BX616_007404 [Lobosporangium transversale]|uniref:Uncharacterized protein n=1 Tax=Lobosporangium transversale TaxID=64571 RepID=A0A1Y2GWS6_9FUNG|nr:hypothetical protein BCR41DRAFT_347860 [Lobosporangium transversale]KAF9914869.1 hypothetical protein BX616_007404 [Lobosporangium transversale]ORZ26746.1 hypothetical protein BCR41DRAFT_347860 [Lobosporangium transversale]|eukprot:XP_021884509.1 hypothetical protein BCR41DRAFT_347860 [Lobosporangium transversale]
MSLLHSRPVIVQRVYYKPSTMARLKALFSSRHHRDPRIPVATTTATPRRTHRKKIATRQPKVRKPSLFHRPRRTLVVTQRKPGFLASLRPRRHLRRTAPAPAPVPITHGRHHKRHGHHRGSTMAALLAALSQKKKHGHQRHYVRPTPRRRL